MPIKLRFKSGGTSYYGRQAAPAGPTGATAATVPVLAAGPVTVGQAFPQAAVPTGFGLTASGLTVQTDVKTAWPDGSARHALLSFAPGSTGNVTLSAGTAATGSFSPTVPTATVTLTECARFCVLGDFVPTGTQLSVRLANAGNGRVIADAVRLVDVAGGTATVLGATAATIAGTWGTATAPLSRSGTVLTADGTAGTSTATWSFTGLVAGHVYRIAASWVDRTGVDHAQNAPYTVWSGAAGTGTNLGTVALDQRTLPSDCAAAVRGPYTVASGTLKVKLTADTSGRLVLASLVAVCRVDAQGPVRSVNVNAAAFAQTGFSAEVYATGQGGVGPLSSYNSTTNNAVWTFTGLPSGSYRVYVYHPISGWHYATAAGYTVFDNTTQVGTFTVDQTVADSIDVQTAVYSAALPTGAGTLTASGPVMQQWRRAVTPLRTDDSSNTPHACLKVFFDLRCYASGAAHVGVVVDNARNVSAARKCNYSVTVTVNGSTAYSDVCKTHYYLTRWVEWFAAGSLGDADTDWATNVAAGMAPSYLPTMNPLTYAAPTGASFGRLELGGLPNSDFDAPGGSASIGYFPDWDARWVALGDQTAKAWSLKTADRGGSLPMCVREGTDDLPYYSVNTHPGAWFDSRDTSSWAANWDGQIVSPTDHFAPSDQHQPDLAYCAYLATGREYYADQLSYHASWALLVGGPSGRGVTGTEGTIVNAAARGLAWLVRLMVNAAAGLPDAHPAKTYLTAKVNNTLAWYDQYVAGTAPTWTGNPTTGFGRPSNALGSALEILNSGYNTGTNGYVVVATWQNDMVTLVWQRAIDLGFTGGTAFRNRLIDFRVGFFANDPSWPIADCCPFFPAVGRFTPPLSLSTVPTYATTWAAAHVIKAEAEPGTLAPGSYYGAYGATTLRLGVKLGRPNAAAALVSLTASPGVPALIAATPAFAIQYP